MPSHWTKPWADYIFEAWYAEEIVEFMRKEGANNLADLHASFFKSVQDDLPVIGFEPFKTLIKKHCPMVYEVFNGKKKLFDPGTSQPGSPLPPPSQPSQFGDLSNLPK